MVAVVTLAAGLLAACSDDGGDGAGTTDPSPSMVEETTTSAEPEEPAVELANTAWTLVSIESDGTIVPTPGAPVPAVVSFGEEGEVEVYDGVNNAAGEYSTEDGLRIDLEPASTAAYPNPRLPQHVLIATLPDARSAEIVDEQLLIALEGGAQLVFESSTAVAPN